MQDVNEKMYKLGSERSAIRELFEKGKELKKTYGEKKVFDFSIGNPVSNPPKEVKEVLIDLINNKNPIELHGYTSAQGDAFVRRSISKYLNEKYFANTNEEYIYMTSGAAAGITITLKAIVNEGDEVIVFSPYFPEYKVFIENAGGIVVTVKPDDETFFPDFYDLKEKITNKTKLIIVNSPNNPTGVFYDEAVIKKIVEILSEKEKEYNKNIFLLSDEPYRELLYVDKKYPFVTNYYKNSIVTYSFSKSLSLPGERIGYILVNESCNNAKKIFDSICGAGRSMGFVCATTIFQYMVPKVLGLTSDFQIYEKNRQFLINKLKDIGYEIVNSDGAFYLFIKTPIEEKEFSNKALKYNLLLTPSESFGIKGYVRLAYCVDYETVVNSIESFKKLYEECIKNGNK